MLILSHELLSRITVDADICHGKPCVRGLRYPVELLLGLLSVGETEAEILAEYEDLEAEDFRAVQAFSSELVRTKSFAPLLSA